MSLTRRSRGDQQGKAIEEQAQQETTEKSTEGSLEPPTQRRPRPTGIQVEQARRKLLVQRLEERERHIGFIASVVLLAFFLALVIPQWHRHVPKNQLGPPELLGVGIGLALLLLVGTLLRRRATLAFAAFLAGFALLSFGGIILAFPYLFIAGWILIKAWKTEHSMEPLPAGTGSPSRSRSSRGSRLAEARQRGATTGARAATRSSRPRTATTRATGSQRKKATATVTPSKRYTPPKPRKRLPPPKPETLTETVATKLFARGSSSKQTQE